MPNMCGLRRPRPAGVPRRTIWRQVIFTVAREASIAFTFASVISISGLPARRHLYFRFFPRRPPHSSRNPPSILLCGTLTLLHVHSLIPRTNPHPRRPKRLDERHIHMVQNVDASVSPPRPRPSCPEFWPKPGTSRSSTRMHFACRGRGRSLRGNHPPSAFSTPACGEEHLT